MKEKRSIFAKDNYCLFTFEPLTDYMVRYTKKFPKGDKYVEIISEFEAHQKIDVLLKNGGSEV